MQEANRLLNGKWSVHCHVSLSGGQEISGPSFLRVQSVLVQRRSLERAAHDPQREKNSSSLFSKNCFEPTVSAAPQTW